MLGASSGLKRRRRRVQQFSAGSPAEVIFPSATMQYGDDDGDLSDGLDEFEASHDAKATGGKKVRRKAAAKKGESFEFLPALARRP